mmetsp:Transcript_1428/g.3340  ORF Transcript_1428/g.3340 Transcript_1428/m.3340 type:complete len:143 (+) Transcript_1428:36-464(+)
MRTRSKSGVTKPAPAPKAERKKTVVKKDSAGGKTRGYNEKTKFFWDVARKLLERKEVTVGSMMGFPCLRAEGKFFAMCEHRTGELIAKMSRQRVQEMISSGQGKLFAPAKTPFREWVLVAEQSEEDWLRVMDEALRFVSEHA